MGPWKKATIVFTVFLGVMFTIALFIFVICRISTKRVDQVEDGLAQSNAAHETEMATLNQRLDQIEGRTRATEAQGGKSTNVHPLHTYFSVNCTARDQQTCGFFLPR